MEGGGINLAWVLFIQIRSLAFILGSSVSGSFSLFFSGSSYSTRFFLLLISHCFSLFLFVFLFPFSFLEVTRTSPFWREVHVIG